VTAPVLATRVRRARKPGQCAICPAPVYVRQSIGYLPGRGWCHVGCIIQHNRAQAPDTSDQEGTPPCD
jgi:hypothetical protein